MPNNRQDSGGQTDEDMDRMSQGQRGGYGNTTQEAGGSQQGKEMDKAQQGQMGSQGGGRRTGGQGGNDEM